jgi:pyruvate formate lyase activating enzyme
LKINNDHITHTADTNNASLRFWGCIMSCQGCLCQEGNYDQLLRKKVANVLVVDNHLQQRFLDLVEVLDRLAVIRPRRILLTGEEATLDANYAIITRVFNDRFNFENVLCAN